MPKGAAISSLHAADEEVEKAKVRSLCHELAALVERWTVADGGHSTAIPELQLYRFSNPTEPAEVMQQPAVYVVVQGRKQVTVGEEDYVYDPSQYLPVSLELPAIGRVMEA